jgi:cholesterol oxidase
MFSMPESTSSQSKRLGSPLATLWGSREVSEPFDVVIVGSGYGGAVAAAQLAGATIIDKLSGQPRKLRVCLLERGEEYLPGEFPSHFGELPRHVRIGDQMTGKVTGVHQGLFDLRLGPDVAALVANGLGGGSLINAGVMLAPRAEDFKEDSVFRGVIDDLHATNMFDCARAQLGGTNSIENHAVWAGQPPLPKKTIALKKLAGNRKVEHPPITVSMRGGANHAGVNLEACTLCGDCLTGCNVGAKDSLDANLLEIAHRGDVQIFTGATVLSIRRSNERKDRLPEDAEAHWVLRVVHTDPRLQEREPDHLRIRAHKVILSAGTLGSTEILLRSRDEKLVFSPRLGERFSCNGDNIAAVHQMPEEVNGRADPQTGVSAGARTVGPTITGSLPIPPDDAALASDRENLNRRGFLVQEFAVPAALRQFFDELVTTRQVLENLPLRDREFHGTRRAEQTDPMAVDEAAMQRSLLVGVIGHDAASGVLHLSKQSRPRDRPPQQGALMIRWPQARHGHELNAAHKALETLVAALKGSDHSQPSLIPNPMWRLIPDQLAELVSQPRGPVLTVHALGGCAIGRNADDGVVDEFGVVFDANPGRREVPTWQGSLVVLDGSIIPGSLGVNPSLTISAVALRAMEKLMARTDWQFTPRQPGGPPEEHASDRRRLPLPAFEQPRATQVEIVERLRGPVRLHAGGSFPTPCIVDLTIHYKAAELSSLISRERRELKVDPDHSRLRVFDQTVFDREGLRFEPDSVLSRHALLEASLSGSLRFMHREPSGEGQRIVRSIPGWFKNRGLRDLLQKAQKFREAKGSDDSRGVLGWFKKAWEIFTGFLSAASRAGEVRRFDYALKLETIEPSQNADAEPIPSFFNQGDEIRGVKRLTYGRRANPWRQLSELTITRMRQKAPAESAVLKLDLSFLAREGVPLVRIVGQQDHAKALADLASFGLYMSRVILNNHLWTFRKPDQPDQPDLREPQRLPGPIAGLAPPEITELKVGLMPDSDEPIVVRLTRYRKSPQSTKTPKAAKALPPLVMIHGYSVSGNTFTHKSLAPSAAEFFCLTGRDVWVVDLRTSTALPTATRPWALEDPALVDIPAALLHIRTVTGQPVDVLAHCVGCAMLSMALLTDASDIRSSVVQLGTETWITEEQLGTLTAFNGANPKGGPHPCIRRIVLSQKGPVLRYTDDNIFRSFMLRKLRRLVLSGDYQFRPPANPGVASQLFDRLLSSLPYPAEDFDVENPWPQVWKSTPWTATRHRMDLLYGRDFSAARLDDSTLEAIDDLFGPMSIESVAQIIHFARFNAITNQSGRGEFVTGKRLRDRWGGIKTLAIHGRENGLVDVSTQDLLSKAMQHADVPFRSSSSDHPPYDRLGHQDVLIGTTSEAVFQDIEAFLGEEPTVGQRPDTGGNEVSDDQAVALIIELPWIGPRIDLLAVGEVPPVGQSLPLQIAAMSSPDQGRASLALVPVCKHPPQAGANNATFEILTTPTPKVSDKGSSNEWLKRTLPPLPQHCGQPHNGESGFIAVMVYEPGEVTAAKSVEAGGAANFPFQSESNKSNPRPRPLTPAEVLAAVQQWMPMQTAERLETAFLRCDDLRRAITLHDADKPQAVRFAFGSCQYPPGVFDRPIAEASMRKLAASLDGADGADAPDLVLLLGDQIYADATAGIADAARIDERFEQPHVDALRMAPLREVMRRRSVRALIDDHELSNNWEPFSADLAAKRPEDAKRNQQTLMKGREAFLRYQRMRPVRGSFAVRNAILSRPVDQAFNFGGHPFYLLDTRTGRSPRGSSITPYQGLIIDERQWFALRVWLLKNPHALKFVATPSVLLARSRHTADHEMAFERSDAWDGFPQSVQQLIEFLYFNRITNTVFLSGDEHQSFHSEATVTSADDSHRLKIVSVHSSALYAPFAFANGRPTDFLLSDSYSVGRCNLVVTTTLAPPGDGYAVIEVPAGQQPPHHLNLHYLKAQGNDDGPGPVPISLPL